MQISRPTPDLLQPRTGDPMAPGTSEWPSSFKKDDNFKREPRAALEAPEGSSKPGCLAFKSHHDPPGGATSSDWFRGLGR